jgi:hypothetical protein
MYSEENTELFHCVNSFFCLMDARRSRISGSCQEQGETPGSMGVPPVWALVWQRKPVSKQARRLFSLLLATFADASVERRFAP